METRLSDGTDQTLVVPADSSGASGRLTIAVTCQSCLRRRSSITERLARALGFMHDSTPAEGYGVGRGSFSHLISDYNFDGKAEIRGKFSLPQT
jgi:hypothetical protein